ASELARDKADTFFGIRREDSRRGVRLRFTHRDWSIGGFAPVAEIAFEKQISNNVIYSYKNTRAAIGFTRQF
ncbi:MAG: DUF560 domain-containing protein, partial [Alphaproteobacteria bacterium]|nr:DUF560 domain-containing protein [Alphaproteobacteria bacterium]